MSLNPLAHLDQSMTALGREGAERTKEWISGLEAENNQGPVHNWLQGIAALADKVLLPQNKRHEVTAANAMLFRFVFGDTPLRQSVEDDGVHALLGESCDLTAFIRFLMDTADAPRQCSEQERPLWRRDSPYGSDVAPPTAI